MELEIWKPFPDFEHWYEISNKGRARSIDKEVTYTRKNGSTFKQIRKGVILKHATHKGYNLVSLKKDKKSYTVYLHRAVLKAFCPKDSYEGLVSNHKSGIKGDNRLENLEWVDYKRNTDHYWNELNHGKYERGKKFSDKKILKVYNMYVDGFSVNSISEKLGIDNSTISSFLSGRNHGHLLDKSGLKNLIKEEKDRRNKKNYIVWAEKNWEKTIPYYLFGFSALNVHKITKTPKRYIIHSFKIIEKNNPEFIEVRKKISNENKKFAIQKFFKDGNKRKKCSYKIEKKGRKIKCINNGKVYDKVKLAAEDLGLFSTHISKQAKGKQESVKGYRFEYVD